MLGEIRQGLAKDWCTGEDSFHFAETKDSDTITERTCGYEPQKWSCLQINVSTLHCVLCWSNFPTFANPL